jgi:glycosyltransferase involved in cell wall biosynthesis
MPDLLCFSHLRWNDVPRRPQHLLARFARDRRVFFFEEPLFGAARTALDVRSEAGVTVAVPHLPSGAYPADHFLRHLLDELLLAKCISEPVLWYDTPTALVFSRHLRASAIVFDCMDELSTFTNATASLLARETELLDRADVVFTRSQSLCESKRGRHPNCHAFPDSIDSEHFRQARQAQSDPHDQQDIPHPRVGFFGVVDERLDLELIAEVARLRPDWHQIIVGPVARIDQASLPVAGNIHYLGTKAYQDLPRYLAGWDAAYLPFARNAATRFISPAKTPEYLAGGRSVVSTSIADVVRTYGQPGLVKIADAPEEFATALDVVRAESDSEWLRRVDDHLSGFSWDRTCAAMNRLIEDAVFRAAVARSSWRDESRHAPQAGHAEATGRNPAARH